MTLSEWIKQYCADNNITLPDGIPDEKTALQFLNVNASGGGGNPNSVQVITGTLASVWDDLSTEDARRFVEAYKQGGASAWIVCDLSGFGGDDATKATAFLTNASPYPVIQFGMLKLTNTPHLAFQVDFVWMLSSEGIYIKHVSSAMFSNDEVTDTSEYASRIPTTLTIYWHPMPEDN